MTLCYLENFWTFFFLIPVCVPQNASHNLPLTCFPPGCCWWTWTLHRPCLHRCFYWTLVLHLIDVVSDNVLREKEGIYRRGHDKNNPAVKELLELLRILYPQRTKYMCIYCIFLLQLCWNNFRWLCIQYIKSVYINTHWQFKHSLGSSRPLRFDPSPTSPTPNTSAKQGANGMGSIFIAFGTTRLGVELATSQS